MRTKRAARLLAGVVGVASLLPGCGGPGPDGDPGPVGSIVAGTPARNVAEFEAILENHRARLGIPAISAAITRGEHVVWARGFGLADVARSRPATPSTPFHLASLTKTFASTVVMQLVEEGRLDLDAPVSDFGISLDSPGVVRVRHLLTHTSEGVPGSAYHYNGERFGLLDRVVEGASGETFCARLVREIVTPLSLRATAPNPLAVPNCLLATPAERAAFQQTMAQGYSSDGRTPVEYPSYFGCAAGLVASVLDVATYSIAIDQHRLLRPETQELVFTPAVSNSGQTLPYGLGWFVQDPPGGVKIVWHYGYWTANSSLVVKVPERGLAFVVLANTDMLSRGSPGIGSDAEVRRSVWAQEFLHAFVSGDGELPVDPI